MLTLSFTLDSMGESQTSGLLSPAVFQAHVSPVLLKLFEVHEEHVRLVLLSHLDAYGELFTQKELKSIILPQVNMGIAYQKGTGFCSGLAMSVKAVCTIQACCLIVYADS